MGFKGVYISQACFLDANDTFSGQFYYVLFKRGSNIILLLPFSVSCIILANVILLKWRVSKGAKVVPLFIRYMTPAGAM